MKVFFILLALLAAGTAIADCKMKVSIYGGPSKDVPAERADARRVRGTVARILRDKGYTPYEVPYDSRAHAWDAGLEISFIRASSPMVTTNSSNKAAMVIAALVGGMIRNNGGVNIQYSLKGSRLADAYDLYTGDPRDIRVKLASLETVLESIPVSSCY